MIEERLKINLKEKKQSKKWEEYVQVICSYVLTFIILKTIMFENGVNHLFVWLEMHCLASICRKVTDLLVENIGQMCEYIFGKLTKK